jgi:S-DNA-T family DNA segregation ATPase FtsK/SpoIIIE
VRKEIIGIVLFFLVIFTLISLLSYSPNDPSINNARAGGNIHNLFGVFGAHTAGILIGLFGIGSFWLPVLLLLMSIHFFGKQPDRTAVYKTLGGLFLIITTGSLLALHNDSVAIFGGRFSSGGVIGIPLKSFLVKYTNHTGGIIILFLVWLIGFILTTGFSLIRFAQFIHRKWGGLFDRLKTLLIKLKTLLIKWKERREKARKRTKVVREKKKQKVPEVTIKAPKPRPIKKVAVPKQDVFEFMRGDKGFQLPSVNFLEDPDTVPVSADNENLRMQSKLLTKKLEDFGVKGSVVTVTPGPVITTFEYAPAPGVKINKIVNLADDLALTLRATSIRIVAPIPGKAVIGIEIPNAERETVRFKEIVVSGVFEKSKSPLTLCLGKDIVGNPVVTQMNKMPHLLIAGATGAGKSVALNTMISGFLYKSSPDDLKLIMVDPKRIELSMYDGIPHLITPVVTSAKKATNALFWAVKEMERRYEILSEQQTRNIDQYNQKVAKQGPDKDGNTPEKLPYIVIIIDELADLMMVASRDVEVALMRLAQMARAAGIHLVIATQRPSVDVLTGIIKANFPTRLTFQVSSKTDSRTIIDTNGAESLLGNGDMLFLPPGAAKLQRIHGAYISEAEVVKITEFLKSQRPPEYLEDVIQAPVEEAAEEGEREYDEKYDEAVALVTRTRQASISMVQRHLRIGYNRAARIVETMEQEGLVGPSDGAKAREVLVRGYEDLD